VLSFTEEFIFEREEDTERPDTLKVFVDVFTLDLAFEISSMDSSPIDMIELAVIEEGFISEIASAISTDSSPIDVIELAVIEEGFISEIASAVSNDACDIVVVDISDSVGISVADGGEREIFAESLSFSSNENSTKSVPSFDGGV